MIHDPDREQSSFLSGDHIELCKFGHSDDDKFGPVWDGVEWLIGRKPKPVGSSAPVRWDVCGVQLANYEAANARVGAVRPS